MKKICFSFAFIALTFLASCGSDDSGNNPVAQERELIGKWSPNKVSTTILMQNIEQEYPHKPTCAKDYISLEANNVSRTYTHSDTCEVEELEQNWSYVNNDLTITLFGFQITGKVISQTTDLLIIESNSSEYAQIISQFTDLPIPEGTMIKLHLDKIN